VKGFYGRIGQAASERDFTTEQDNKAEANKGIRKEEDRKAQERLHRLFRITAKLLRLLQKKKTAVIFQ